VILIVAVADLWGIWYFQDHPIIVTAEAADPGYYKSLEIAQAACGGNLEPRIVYEKGDSGKNGYVFTNGSCTNEKYPNFNAVPVNYDPLSGDVSQPSTEYLGDVFIPFSLSDWRVTADQAFVIPSAAERPHSLEYPGTHFYGLSLFNRDNRLCWDAVYFEEGNLVVYEVYIDARTGAIVKKDRHHMPTD